MNREAQRKLKFDVRLEQRPGWLSEEEKQAELARLEDSTENVDSGDESSEPQPDQEPQSPQMSIHPAPGEGFAN